MERERERRRKEKEIRGAWCLEGGFWWVLVGWRGEEGWGKEKRVGEEEGGKRKTGK